MRVLSLIIYYALGSRLPASSMPGGKLWNAVRTGLLKMILPIGNGNRVQQHVYIGKGRSIRIGSHCQINENVRLIDVTIGDYVMIAPNVNVIGGKVHNHDRTDIPMAQQGETNKGPVIIADDVWIGVNAVIMAGVRVGKGAIVGAGSIVSKDVAPYTIVGGIPARVIANRLSAGVTAPET